MHLYDLTLNESKPRVKPIKKSENAGTFPDLHYSA